MKKPLMSFCLRSYNQKEYFKQALEAAFSQMYENLEIVIVDDGSTDGSHEVILDRIAEYRRTGGRHSVIYKHSERNLGHWGSTEEVFNLAHGELCINADGDDISLPNRVQVIADAWAAGGKKATVIEHGCLTIDQGGNPCPAPWKEPPSLYGDEFGALNTYCSAAIKKFPKVFYRTAMQHFWISNANRKVFAEALCFVLPV